MEPKSLNLVPAKWIWFASERTLANTFVLFRKEIKLRVKPVRVSGWITADSRYRLSLNGERMQWGPAPCDPRAMEADPVDLTSHFKVGMIVLGVEALYFGMGDATWMMGKPGLILRLEIEYESGEIETVVTDHSWLALIDRAHRPGRPRRWYLRALQEEFDARLHPYGWDNPGFVPGPEWMPAFELDTPADKPTLAGKYVDYAQDVGSVNSIAMKLLERQIPLLKEIEVAPVALAETGRIRWHRDPQDWFDFRIPNSFEIQREALATPLGNTGCILSPGIGEREGVFATFKFEEGIVGWPSFTIDAPAGTIVEVIVREGHDPKKTAWLDSGFFSWTRLICREGPTHFECFDYEALRWIQFHVRNSTRPIKITKVSVRRRLHAWPETPRVQCSELELQRLFNAGLNTVRNSAHDIVGEVSRERQQYPGDAGCLLQTARYAFGDRELSKRYLRTFAGGQTHEGYFLDCWPAVDRLNRIPQRLLGLTPWGPQLDLGGNYLFDAHAYYMETGDIDTLREPLLKMIKFGDYLLNLVDSSGLLPVENLGVPVVWMEHTAYKKQHHKQCAYNLFMAAALRYALVPMLQAAGHLKEATQFSAAAQEIERAVIQKFWDEKRGLFVNNLPWLKEEQTPRLDDRALATAILFDQCPGQRTTAAADVLENGGPELGISYPCNSGWRYTALAKLNRIQPVLQEFRERWATMQSVVENNTLQENWEAQADSREIWTHNNPVPNNFLFECMAGVKALEPGYARYAVIPQLGDIEEIGFVARLAVGKLEFLARRTEDGHVVTLKVPELGVGEVRLPDGAECGLKQIAAQTYRLNPGKQCEIFIPRNGKNTLHKGDGHARVDDRNVAELVCAGAERRGLTV